MTTATTVILGIIILFVLFVLVRSVAHSFKICALCAAVSLTWITLLTLLYLNYSVDPILVGILMGGSVVGLMGLLEEKLSETHSLFKLPFYLSLVTLAYFTLGGAGLYYGVIAILLLWIITLFIYLNQTSAYLKTVAKKLIQCCKNW